MKTLTKEELADVLNNREYQPGNAGPAYGVVFESNLVVLYGHSDDLIRVRGVVCDEIYICGDEQLALVLAGEKIDDEEAVIDIDTPCIVPLSNDYDNETNPRLIIARCDFGEDTQPRWEFNTNMPHADFLLYRDGKQFCKGIVIDLDEIEPIK